MIPTIPEPVLIVALLIGGAVLMLILIFTVLPFLAQMSLFVEASALMTEAIGDYFGNPRLINLACLVTVLILVSCCCLVIIGGVAVTTCFTSTPSRICQVLRPQ